MHIKKATGYVLSRAEEENLVSRNQYALSICNLEHDSFKNARINSEEIRSPTVESIKNQIKIEPVLQNEIKETVDVPNINVQNFYNYLILKSMENTGYSNFLYISEMLSTTCDDCKESHGRIYSINDFEKGIVSIPRHPNCKCSLIALDKEGEQAYYFDKDNFLEWILKNTNQRSGRIYKLKDGKIQPAVENNNGKESSGQTQQQWYEQLKHWAEEFGNDAKSAWDSVVAESTKRTQNMFKDVPSFLDWLTMGVVSGFFDSNTGRFEEMVKKPNIHSVANWLCLGLPDTINGTFNPEKPLSLQHWIDSLGLVIEIYGTKELASRINRPKPPKVDPEALFVTNEKFLTIDGKINWAKYAPNDGYVVGSKINGQTLNRGTIIDRYGAKSGRYTSPVGVPYEHRSLPFKENLNAYHKYKVVKPIDNVTQGKIASAFDQIGGGIQYELPTNVAQLIKDGYLKEIK